MRTWFSGLYSNALTVVRATGVMMMAGAIGACAGGQVETGGDAVVSENQANGARGCTQSENLLLDTEFSETRGGVWTFRQHTGEISFSVEREDGGILINKFGKEPWMLYTQSVAFPVSGDATLRFSAELKGQIEYEPPLHGFDHIAGLFLQPGKSRSASRVATHQPNRGQWDWQTMTIEAALLPGATSAQAGFVHQGGGSLWARNPSLVVIQCN